MMVDEDRFVAEMAEIVFAGVSTMFFFADRRDGAGGGGGDLLRRV